MKLIKHSIYNLLGLGLPLVVAVFSIPVLVKGLGDAKFGLLTLIWALVSYFGLFDLGLGRALTQQLASILNGPRHEESGRIAFTSLVMMFLLGVFASAMIFIFGPVGIGYLKSASDQQEAINSVYIMGAVMPFILLTSGFRGILEAKHHFGVINAMRIPMGLFTFIGPIIVVLYFGSNLELITLVLVIGRVLACIAHGWYAWLAIGSDHGVLGFDKKLLKPLCFSGGWMTISNIVSPLMGYVDRFVIGFSISAAAVAFYTTPQEMVTKLWIIPGALTSVLFPAFANSHSKNNIEMKRIFHLSIKMIFLSVIPIVICLVLFSDEILGLWINKDFAINSQAYLKVFSIGILVNCMAHVPYTLIQGAGRSKLTAYFHLIQFPIYFSLLWLLALNYGILGAAIAWLIRILIDSILMFGGAYKLMGWKITLKEKGKLIKNIIAFMIFFSIISLTVISIFIKFIILLFTGLVALVYLIKLLKNEYKNKSTG